MGPNGAQEHHREPEYILLKHSGFTTHVTKSGSGDPVFFLHGFPDSSEVWSDTIQYLSESYTCYAIDLPGLGRSIAAKRANFQLTNLSQFFLQVLDELGVSEPIHLVVHDLGAFTGLAFASDHPMKVRSLSIFNSDFHSDFTWYFWAKIWRTPIIGEIAMYFSSFSIFVKEMQNGSIKLSIPYLRSVYDNISFYNRRMALKHFRAWNKKDLEVYEERYQTNTKDIPKHVFWGKLDPYSPEKYAARFGTDEVIYSEDSGHWLMIEEPELVKSGLKSFLGKCS